MHQNTSMHQKIKFSSLLSILTNNIILKLKFRVILPLQNNTQHKRYSSFHYPLLLSVLLGTLYMFRQMISFL